MRIGQLADASGVSTKTIRYYETIGVLRQAEREDNGYRVYAARDIERLTFIRDAQTAGLTLDEIRHILDLKAKGMSTCGHVRSMLEGRLADVTHRITMLETARDELERLTARARDLDPTACTDPDRCQAIGVGTMDSTPAR